MAIVSVCASSCIVVVVSVCILFFFWDKMPWVDTNSESSGSSSSSSNPISPSSPGSANTPTPSPARSPTRAPGPNNAPKPQCNKGMDIRVFPKTGLCHDHMRLPGTPISFGQDPVPQLLDPTTNKAVKLPTVEKCWLGATYCDTLANWTAKRQKEYEAWLKWDIDRYCKENTDVRRHDDNICWVHANGNIKWATYCCDTKQINKRPQ